MSGLEPGLDPYGARDRRRVRQGTETEAPAVPAKDAFRGLSVSDGGPLPCLATLATRHDEHRSHPSPPQILRHIAFRSAAHAGRRLPRRPETHPGPEGGSWIWNTRGQRGPSGRKPSHRPADLQAVTGPFRVIVGAERNENIPRRDVGNQSQKSDHP